MPKIEFKYCIVSFEEPEQHYCYEEQRYCYEEYNHKPIVLHESNSLEELGKILIKEYLEKREEMEKKYKEERLMYPECISKPYEFKMKGHTLSFIMIKPIIKEND